MSLSEERLAEIRERVEGDRHIIVLTDAETALCENDREDLLDEVDRLRAKHERARADWKTTIKFRTTQRNEERAENARLRAGIKAIRNGCDTLLNPTEGEK